MAFPTLFPSGKYGLDDKRSVKLTKQMYVVSRILNCDRRYSKHAPYCFAALYHIELHQMESSISVSFYKGKLKGGDGNKNEIISIDDGISVFQKQKGTPRYWALAKMELIAKQEQLGPFVFFFTLSCADLRWPETFTAIMKEKGLTITYPVPSIDGSTIHEGTAMVGDQTLEEFMANENLHELIKNDVLTITRVFDNRLRMFVKHIMMGKKQPMKVKTLPCIYY